VSCVLKEPPQNVNELIDAVNVAWNTEKIKAAFLPLDVAVILNIPLSARRQEDFWAWHYEKKGIFSVRSAYCMLVQTRDTRTAWLDKRATSSNHRGEEKGWTSLWKVKVPAKLRVFLR
jgi:hypothetical protein